MGDWKLSRKIIKGCHFDFSLQSWLTGLISWTSSGNFFFTNIIFSRDSSFLIPLICLKKDIILLIIPPLLKFSQNSFRLILSSYIMNCEVNVYIYIYIYMLYAHVVVRSPRFQEGRFVKSIYIYMLYAHVVVRSPRFQEGRFMKFHKPFSVFRDN